MRTTALISTLLISTASARKGVQNRPADRGNSNKVQLGGFETFAQAELAASATVGDCTVTASAGRMCANGVARSFVLTNLFHDEISYNCDCPSACDSASGNAGTGAYTCTTETFDAEFCGDIDIASKVFTDNGCTINANDGTMECEENCYCDAEAHVCTSVGEECCAGSCQRVNGNGRGVGGALKCMEDSEEEEAEVVEVLVMDSFEEELEEEEYEVDE